MAEEQRGPYAEQQHDAGPAAAEEVPDASWTAGASSRCLANLRMLCDSTFLFDKQTNVSPKLDEFAELLRRAADRPGAQGGRVQPVGADAAEGGRGARRGCGSATRCCTAACRAPDRRKLLERFRDDPACRVFLSTDAGGTGLNLQAADTVINLEVPWNPAVLEQRIARVHRMGQHRPVQVFNLVMRDSIEERVLRVLEQKRALFDGLFDGDTDEMSFEALGQQAFLEAVRDLLDGEKRPAASAAECRGGAGEAGGGGGAVPGALAEVLAAERPAAPPDLVQRDTAALRAILTAIGGEAGEADPSGMP